MKHLPEVAYMAVPGTLKKQVKLPVTQRRGKGEFNRYFLPISVCNRLGYPASVQIGEATETLVEVGNHHRKGPGWLARGSDLDQTESQWFLAMFEPGPMSISQVQQYSLPLCLWARIVWRHCLYVQDLISGALSPLVFNFPSYQYLLSHTEIIPNSTSKSWAFNRYLTNIVQIQNYRPAGERASKTA